MNIVTDLDFFRIDVQAFPVFELSEQVCRQLEIADCAFLCY